MITPEINAKARAAYNKTRRQLDPTGEKRMQAALQAVAADIRNAALEEAKKAEDALDHAANEWADTACSAVAFIKNIESGLHTPEQALGNLKQQLEHCRSVWAHARALKTKVTP